MRYVGVWQLIHREVRRDPQLPPHATWPWHERQLRKFDTWRARRPFTRRLVEEYAAHLQANGLGPDDVNRVLATVRWWAMRLLLLAVEDKTLDPARRQEMIERSVGVAEVANIGGKGRGK